MQFTGQIIAKRILECVVESYMVIGGHKCYAQGRLANSRLSSFPSKSIHYFIFTFFFPTKEHRIPFLINLMLRTDQYLFLPSKFIDDRT